MQTGPALPAFASAASLVRFELARQLAARCPASLGAVIALTGSSARGLAGDDSDAEMNHWVERLPPLKARAGWLIEAGITDVEAEPTPRSDGSEWFQGRWGEIALEAGWQTFDSLEASLHPLLTGESVERDRLRLGELLVSAVMLRANERLQGLQQALTHFPDPLRDRLITELSAPLQNEATWATVDKLARRGERLAVMRSLGDSLKTALWLCFAVNRRWEASDKWLLTMAARLPMMPPGWRPRLDAALSAPPVRAVELARRWCEDALALPR